MTPRAGIIAVVACAVGLGSACASTPDARMHRALDASIERVVRTDGYLRSVAGISSHPSRFMRGDGFIYISDVAPVLRYLAEVRDTARFQTLREFVTGKLMRSGPAGIELARRYRPDQGFEPATVYGIRWTRKALADGWRVLGDTASAVALARLAPFDQAVAQNPSAMYQLTMDCGDAVDVAAAEPAQARAVLGRARQLVGSLQAAREQAALGSSAVEGEVDLLSCLTRLSVAVRDPDATVRYLDDLLGHIQPMLIHSGRPDVGTAADILLTLRRVRAAGPAYAR